MYSVEGYLNETLKPTLEKFGVSPVYLMNTLAVVGNQMNSLLKHWDDISFRKTILLLGLEEGMFYEPSSKLDTKCFVVVTLRNSPIEKLQSDSYRETGLNSILPQHIMKGITSDAIRYFDKADFSKMAQYAKKNHNDDFYYEIMKSHPVTYKALEQLASASSKIKKYDKIPTSAFELSGISSLAVSSDLVVGETTAFDGYSLGIDSNLRNYLQLIPFDTDLFVTDSFKSLSRNFEKLINIIEYVLTRNAAFVTSNFYLENGHVERRTKLLRAGHSDLEIQNNLLNTQGLAHKHANALKRRTLGI